MAKVFVFYYFSIFLTSVVHIISVKVCSKIPYSAAKSFNLVSFCACLTEGLRIESCLLLGSKKGWAKIACVVASPQSQAQSSGPSFRTDIYRNYSLGAPESRPLLKSLPKVKNVCDAGQASDDSTMAMNEGSDINVDCVLRFGRAIWICRRPRSINGWTG